MEKKDSAPPSPSRSPASGSPTAHSAGQASPSSPNTRSRASPSRRELFSPDPYSTASRAASSRQSPGDDDSPRNPDRPLMFRSLEDIYASTDPIEESSGANVPRRLGIQSPRQAKRSGADFHSPGPLISVSSLGNQEKESSAPSQHDQEIKDTVLKQEMVNVEYQTSLGTGSGGPVGSQPGPSGPSPPKRPTGPDQGPQAPGSPSGSSEKPENVRALQSHEGRGGSDDPVGLGGPVGSPSGPGEPSQDTAETSCEHPGSGSGSGSESESGSGPSDKPND